MRGRAAAALLGLAGGALAAALILPRPDPGPPVPACRPTLPALALAEETRPVLLMLGNSLMFDRDWRIAGARVVTCARQGQTAAQAAAVLARLPEVPADAIVLGIGSVEALGRDPDPAAFAVAVATLSEAIAARWPGVPVTVLGPPRFDPAEVPGAPDPATVAALLAALAGVIPAARPIDALFADLDPALASYDGVHLTPAAYARIEAALAL